MIQNTTTTTNNNIGQNNADISFSRPFNGFLKYF